MRITDSTGADITPDGSLQRRLLALLVLRRGLVVSVDTAVDALWRADANVEESLKAVCAAIQPLL